MHADIASVVLEFDSELKFDHDVWVDRLRVQQILINLIQNAIKYSNKGLKVCVTVLRVD